MKNFLDYHIFDKSRTSTDKILYFGYFGKYTYPKNLNKDPIIRISNSDDLHDENNCFYINIKTGIILGECEISEKELDVLLEWSSENKIFLCQLLRELLKGHSGNSILDKLIVY